MTKRVRKVNDGVALGTRASGETVRAEHGAHLLTFAPHRLSAGIIDSATLSQSTTVVVLDPDGVHYKKTAESLTKLGRAIVRLDPFRVIDESTDSINPFDLVALAPNDTESEYAYLAELLFPPAHSVDRLEGAARRLAAAVIGYLCSVPGKNTTKTYVETFHADDVVYSLAVVLDTIGGKIPPSSYRIISNFLQRVEAERSAILGLIADRMHSLEMTSEAVLGALASSTIELGELVSTRDAIIYLIVPSHRLHAFAPIARLMLSALIEARVLAGGRSAMLVLLDECATLGEFLLLGRIVRRRDEAGVQLCTFWRSLADLRAAQPLGWGTLVENSSVMAALGPANFSSVAELVALFGVDAASLTQLRSNEILIKQRGETETLSQI